MPPPRPPVPTPRPAATPSAASPRTDAPLRLAWRPPYDIEAVLGFFARRCGHSPQDYRAALQTGQASPP